MPIVRKINYLVFHLKTMKEWEHPKPKASWRKEIIIIAEVNERIEKKNRENQWNQKLVLWNGQQNWQIFS